MADQESQPAENDDHGLTARERRKRTDGKRRRDAIRAAALRLFWAHGFANTSIRSIARASRSNLASVYYHFGSKVNLYNAAISESVKGFSSFGTFDDPCLSLPDALTAYFSESLNSIPERDDVRLALDLLRRERPLEAGCMVGMPDGLDVQQRWFRVLERHYGGKWSRDQLMMFSAVFAAMGADMLRHIDLQGKSTRQLVGNWPVKLTGCAMAMINDMCAGRTCTDQ